MNKQTVTRTKLIEVMTQCLREGVAGKEAVWLHTPSHSMALFVEPQANRVAAYVKTNHVFTQIFIKGTKEWDEVLTGDYLPKHSNLFDEVLDVYSKIRKENGSNVVSEKARYENVTLFNEGDS